MSVSLDSNGFAFISWHFHRGVVRRV